MKHQMMCGKCYIIVFVPLEQYYIVQMFTVITALISSMNLSCASMHCRKLQPLNSSLITESITLPLFFSSIFFPYRHLQAYMSEITVFYLVPSRAGSGWEECVGGGHLGIPVPPWDGWASGWRCQSVDQLAETRAGSAEGLVSKLGGDSLTCDFIWLNVEFLNFVSKSRGKQSRETGRGYSIRLITH